MLKIFFIGDVFASVGRKMVIDFLQKNKEKLNPDLIIVNVENATHGKAISIQHYEEFAGSGIDFFTLGNHLTARPERALINKKMPKLIWPENMPSEESFIALKSPIIEIKKQKICITSLIGNTFMKGDHESPFTAMKEVIKSKDADFYFVDFHAEATAEKVAFAHAFDGVISAVVGTHTHVPTADSRILPSGTFFKTDVGMTGPHDSIIGSKKAPIIKYMLGKKQKILIEPAKGRGQFCGVMISFDLETKKAVEFEDFYFIDSD